MIHTLKTVCFVLVIAGGLHSYGFAQTATMPDNKIWTVKNLDIQIPGSYCYNDSAKYCQLYGRLYTWEAAQQVCGKLGAGWRLPTNEEWRQLAKQYGGIRDDAQDGGKGAFKALLKGGMSGFNAVLGGGRTQDGHYARGNAHGFYWTATATDSSMAWFYNFGKGSGILNRHNDGENAGAFSVRCIKDK